MQAEAAQSRSAAEAAAHPVPDVVWELGKVGIAGIDDNTATIADVVPQGVSAMLAAARFLTKEVRCSSGISKCVNVIMRTVYLLVMAASRHVLNLTRMDRVLSPAGLHLKFMPCVRTVQLCGQVRRTCMHSTTLMGHGCDFQSW